MIVKMIWKKLINNQQHMSTEPFFISPDTETKNQTQILDLKTLSRLYILLGTLRKPNWCVK